MNADRQKPEGRLVFWLVYAAVILALLRQVPSAESLSALMFNDDIMRLVEVRDWRGGQGWSDLMQYRMGPEGGTLMHWSRVVDAPIAGVIWLAGLFVSPNGAEAVAMVLWPLALAGVFLAAIQQGGRALGGAVAGNFALLLGALALLATQKFDAGSLDHHNVQLVAIALAAGALMLAKPSAQSGAVAGLAGAISLAVGLEAILFVAVMALYVALKWAIMASRSEALGYSAAFALGLAGLYLGLQPDFSATAFRCDAFGADLAGIGIFGAAGLGVLAFGASGRGLWMRLLLVAGLGAGVLGYAYFFAPSCLANPLDQLSPDVARLWLGQVEEAQTLWTYVRLNAGANAGLLLSPLVALGMAVWLVRDRKLAARGLLLLALVAIGYGMTLYQNRGMSFLMVLMVLPVSAMLARLYLAYKAGAQAAGLGVLALMLLAIPDVPTIAYMAVQRGEAGPERAPVLAAGGASCTLPSAFAEVARLPAGMVLSSADLGAGLLAYTPHRVLSANFHRNQAGLQAGIDLARAPLFEVPERLAALGVKYLVFCPTDAWLLSLAPNAPDRLWARLYAGDPPPYLIPVLDGGLVVYEFISEKEP